MNNHEVKTAAELQIGQIFSMADRRALETPSDFRLIQEDGEKVPLDSLMRVEDIRQIQSQSGQTILILRVTPVQGLVSALKPTTTVLIHKGEDYDGI